MSDLIVPQDYCSHLTIRETEIAIKKLKDFFENKLAEELNLTRVSAPLFVKSESGLNDNLSGVERPVSFDIKALNNQKAEIVQSLAKWKRLALHRYEFKAEEGLYTDMNAIRRDDKLDNIHSLYVDQWDWEKVIKKNERTMYKLQSVVKKIYNALKETENFIADDYAYIKAILPKDIFFITSQKLEDRYPDLTPEEREEKISSKYKAVFISQIGKKLESGQKHDDRAPDYDDWELNGDIIFWNPVLKQPLEISSMGIRVDKNALIKQLKKTNEIERKQLPFHQMLLNNKLPLTVGGGIGQSRLSMFYLRKAHIGEVQSAIWPEEMIQKCSSANIFLL